ncbi:VOC family protein, partial [Streptomyces scabiei]|uniref:VOC family protein n=1 Tax=Streptomyces scabiei TaxID=1930 RepID=UPI00358E8027
VLHGPPVVGVHVVHDDVHHRRAVEHGVEILTPPTDQDYGSRDYMARDAEGNVWSFGTYAPETGG